MIWVGLSKGWYSFRTAAAGRMNAAGSANRSDIRVVEASPNDANGAVCLWAWAGAIRTISLRTTHAGTTWTKM